MFRRVEQLMEGHIEGLETLVQLYQLHALRTAYIITKSREMAENVVADAFLTVYDHIGQFDPNRPFRPWFYRIVVNGATKAIRKASRKGTGGGVVQEVLEQQPDTEPGPEEKMLFREMRKMLDLAIKRAGELKCILALRFSGSLTGFWFMMLNFVEI